MSMFQFPVFFCMPTAAFRARVHKGWPLLAPELAVKRAEGPAATRALCEKVLEALARNPELAARLVAINEGRPDEIEVDVPWRKGRATIKTPALWFTAGHVPTRERDARNPAADPPAPQQWVALPRFHAVLPASPEDPTVLDKALAGHLRRTGVSLGEHDPEEEEEAELSACGWARQRGDRFVWLDVRANLPEPSLDAGVDLMQLLFGGAREMSGPDELRKVATCLNDLHPDGLRYDAVPDDRVARLGSLLFDDAEPVPTAIIGPRGSGRTTLVHAAIRRRLAIVDIGPAKEAERLSRVHHLDPNRVISGMSRLGQWETRLTAILKHVAKPGGGAHRHGIFVDNAVALARIGRSRGSALSLTRLIRPWIADRTLPFVLEATAEEWTRLEELDRGFTDLFQRIRVEPPAPERAFRILLSAAEAISREEGKTIELSGIRAVLDVEARFPSGRGAPGGLIDRLRTYTRATSESVDHWEVSEATAGETGYTEWVLEGHRVEQVTAWIQKRLTGQPEFEHAAIDLLSTLGAGLVRPGRPIASWLFVGPTGVGKTEAAKVLNEVIFDAPERLIRLDMNEYVDGAAVSRLLGAPENGTLTSRVRAQPSAIVLLDEIEKAHPSVHDLLLQVLDEGWLGDGEGRRVDFSRTIVLMTSNVGAQEVARATGFGARDGSAASATLRAQVWRAAIQSSFRPELVNRIGRVVLFRPLDRATIQAVAERQLTRIFARDGFLRRTFLLSVDPAVVTSLADAGFDPDLGARALKRVLERDLVQPVAEIFAGLPVAEPVRVRLSAGEGGAGMVSAVERWAFARPIEPAPPLAPATESMLRALRDAVPDVRLRASIGPTGTRVSGAAEFALREAIDALLAELPEDAGEIGGNVDLRAQELERLRGRFEGGLYRDYGVGAPRWDQIASARSVREFLLTLPLHAPGPVEAGRSVDERAFRVQDRLRCLLAGDLATPAGSTSVRLCIRPLVDGSRMRWAPFSAYIAGLTALVEGFGASIALRNWTGVWRDGPAQGEGCPAMILDITGLPDARWLDPELGGHVCYPAGEPPSALLVERVPAELAPKALAQLVSDASRSPVSRVLVRLLVPLADRKAALRVTDLRLGRTEEIEPVAFGRLLERLWYPVYGSAGEPVATGRAL